ncbi:MAG: hypothetical protein RL215_631, partial [Planctomycetota bacterium]
MGEAGGGEFHGDFLDGGKELLEAARGGRSAKAILHGFAVNGQDLGICEGVAEAFKVFEGPDDVFFAVDFNELWIGGTGVAVVDENIAGGEHLQGRDPGKLDAREIVLMQAPDDLAGRRDFEDRVSVAGADQCIAVFESESGEDLVAEGVDAVTRPGLASEEWHLVF